MGAHEARDDEVLVPVVDEAVVAADEAAPDEVAAEPTAEAEVLTPAQEAWAPTFDFARKLGTTMLREYGKRAAAVEAAGGAEVEEDGVTLKTPAGIMMERVKPGVSLMPLARAPLSRRWWTPVVEDKPNMLFGWTVAEQSHSGEEAKASDDKKPKSSVLVEMDDESAPHDEGDDAREFGPDEVVERVVLIGGVRRALRLIVGKYGEMTRSQGDQGGPVRIAAAQKGTEEGDLGVIEAYAKRNRFANVTVQAITPELIASGGLNTSDPVALGLRVREGLIALTDQLDDTDY
jgi:hypothetical protein